MKTDLTVKGYSGKWHVVAADGHEVVPFGRYDWIEGFYYGLARVRRGSKWGIIDETGTEVLPVEYDSVWKFLDKDRRTTYVEKNGSKTLIWLGDLTPDFDARWSGSRDKSDDDSCCDYSNSGSYETEHYEEFAGTYAQDYAGYSDEDIYDVFEGDPDAYWNID
ncbi:MAG: WG repeat-containing protein [Muribaculaceae bacterium]